MAARLQTRAVDGREIEGKLADGVTSSVEGALRTLLEVALVDEGLGMLDIAGAGQNPELLAVTARPEHACTIQQSGKKTKTCSLPSDSFAAVNVRGD
ncbi:hypothetical protein CGLO_07243 [Colletotrichum gloeosporioides Cg-14]|uniref:Uncharacterized protein n=1 Tax=Colletotrichum gloeosporioides (strain Cg-14) TaxID=1237896 RepID=T0KCE8_COLGC|nr:hypothetical protein CGLO_07243 [Colletotrichum gloeosporioides Cg-14]